MEDGIGGHRVVGKVADVAAWNVEGVEVEVEAGAIAGVGGVSFGKTGVSPARSLATVASNASDCLARAPLVVLQPPEPFPSLYSRTTDSRLGARRPRCSLIHSSFSN